MKTVKSLLQYILLSPIYFLSFSPEKGLTKELDKKEIKFGMLFDYTGKTKDVARPYIRGLMDY